MLKEKREYFSHLYVKEYVIVEKIKTNLINKSCSSGLKF